MSLDIDLELYRFYEYLSCIFCQPKFIFKLLSFIHVQYIASSNDSPQPSSNGPQNILENKHDFKIFIQSTKCLGHFILQLSKGKDSACEYCNWRNSILNLVFYKKTAVGLLPLHRKDFLGLNLQMECLISANLRLFFSLFYYGFDALSVDDQN